jgi:hypothetical protein
MFGGPVDGEEASEDQQSPLDFLVTVCGGEIPSTNSPFVLQDNSS